jgi:hypothetical protein
MLEGLAYERYMFPTTPEELAHVRVQAARIANDAAPGEAA